MWVGRACQVSKREPVVGGGCAFRRNAVTLPLKPDACRTLANAPVAHGAIRVCPLANNDMTSRESPV
jgi:hypothetical protein